MNSLSRKQREAIPHLVGARSFEKGCKAAKISKGTLYKWLNDPVFKAALGEARDRVTEEAMTILKSSVTGAVETLSSLLEEAETQSIKLRAAEKVIDFFLRNKELQDLEKRLSALEEVIKNAIR